MTSATMIASYCLPPPVFLIAQKPSNCAAACYETQKPSYPSAVVKEPAADCHCLVDVRLCLLCGAIELVGQEIPHLGREMRCFQLLLLARDGMKYAIF